MVVRIRGMFGAVFGLAILLATLGTSSPAAAATGPAWSTVASPNVTDRNGDLAGVSCTAASTGTYCLGVGFFVNKVGMQVGLLSVSAGSTRYDKPATVPKGAFFVELLGVSCSSADTCMAVGDYNAHGVTMTLAESWNGSTSAVLATPNPAGASSSSLFGVSCVSAVDCIAVGSSSGVSTTQTLAEVWNGATWAIHATPSGGSFDRLTAVSCVAANDCAAVGVTGGGASPLAEAWNGVAWSLQTMAFAQGGMASVACTGAAACIAVGGSVQAWNGTSWSILATPPPPVGANYELSGVSCSSATSCFAVGSTVYPSSTFTLAETWNGSVWTVQSTPNPPVTNYNFLVSVSCPSATTCLAAGWARISNQADVILDEAWTGHRWKIQGPNSPIGAAPTALAGISCAALASCIAVGWSYVNGAQAPVAEAWNGASWAMQAAADPSNGMNNNLAGVSCRAANLCIAVGSAGSATLGERWNGTAWSIQATANSSTAASSALSSVACASTTSCMAAGLSSSGGPRGNQAPLTETWNGSSWTLESAPLPADATSGALDSVACVTSVSCVAVGYSNSTSGTGLAEIWNGTAWSLTSMPSPSGVNFIQLFGVACPGANECIAVGLADSGNYVNTSLAEAWNGTAWAIVPTPNVASTSDDQLLAVSCASATSCEAVGEYGNGASTLAEGWNGSAWSIQHTPKTGGSVALAGVGCTSSAACMAAGRREMLFGPTTLTEKYG